MPDDVAEPPKVSAKTTRGALRIACVAVRDLLPRGASGYQVDRLVPSDAWHDSLAGRRDLERATELCAIARRVSGRLAGAEPDVDDELGQAERALYAILRRSRFVRHLAYDEPLRGTGARQPRPLRTASDSDMDWSAAALPADDWYSH